MIGLSSNSRDFIAQLKAARNATEQPFQNILKNYMVFILLKTAQRTPVSPYPEEDPGRLAGSWSISRDHVGSFVIPKGTSSSWEEAYQRAQRLMFSSPYSKWFLYNLVEYGDVVEYGLYPGNGPRTVGGFSTQSPEGMLRLTLAEARELLEEVAGNASNFR